MLWIARCVCTCFDEAIHAHSHINTQQKKLHCRIWVYWSIRRTRINTHILNHIRCCSNAAALPSRMFSPYRYEKLYYFSHYTLLLYLCVNSSFCWFFFFSRFTEKKLHIHNPIGTKFSKWKILKNLLIWFFFCPKKIFPIDDSTCILWYQKQFTPRKGKKKYILYLSEFLYFSEETESTYSWKFSDTQPHKSGYFLLLPSRSSKVYGWKHTAGRYTLR